MEQEACIGKMRNGYKIIVSEPEGKRLLGRHEHRMDNIKMNLKEIGFEGMDWIHLLRIGYSGGFL